WAAQMSSDLGGHETPVLGAVLAGTRAMERRVHGRGGAAAFTRFATIRAFSIPLLWPRSTRTLGAVHVSPAIDADIDEMAALWRRIAPRRQFAPIFDADSMSAWIADAPGLAIHDYRIARSRDGRIVGFLAWWDQSVFKQSRVLRYSPRLAAVRVALNGLARLTHGARLPDVGQALGYRTALHVCVPSARPDVLGALLGASCAEL